jgi:hypothetical protein
MTAEREGPAPQRDTPTENQFGKTVAVSTEENLSVEEMETDFHLGTAERISAEPRKIRLLLSSPNTREK